MKSVIAQQFQKKANIYVCFVLKQGEYSLRASDEWLKFGRVARDDVGKRKRKRLCEFAGLVLELFPPPAAPTPRGRAPTHVGWYLTPLRPFVQERVHSHVDRRLQPIRPTQQLDGLLLRQRGAARVCRVGHEEGGGALHA